MVVDERWWLMMVDGEMVRQNIKIDKRFIYNLINFPLSLYRLWITYNRLALQQHLPSSHCYLITSNHHLLSSPFTTMSTIIKCKGLHFLTISHLPSHISFSKNN